MVKRTETERQAGKPVSPLRRWREQRQLTAPQLAALLGANTRTVEGWESGKRHPDPWWVLQIEAVTEISPRDLARFAVAARGLTVPQRKPRRKRFDALTERAA